MTEAPRLLDISMAPPLPPGCHDRRAALMHSVDARAGTPRWALGQKNPDAATLSTATRDGTCLTLIAKDSPVTRARNLKALPLDELLLTADWWSRRQHASDLHWRNDARRQPRLCPSNEAVPATPAWGSVTTLPTRANLNRPYDDGPICRPVHGGKGSTGPATAKDQLELNTCV